MPVGLEIDSNLIIGIAGVFGALGMSLETSNATGIVPYLKESLPNLPVHIDLERSVTATELILLFGTISVITGDQLPPHALGIFFVTTILGMIAARKFIEHMES